MAEGRAVVRLPDADHLNNHVRTQHAGALFSLGEAASGAAMLGAFAAQMNTVTPLARSAQIDYNRLAMGPIEAIATLEESRAAITRRLDRDGRARFDIDVDLSDSQGAMVATMTVKWHLVAGVELSFGTGVPNSSGAPGNPTVKPIRQ